MFGKIAVPERGSINPVTCSNPLQSRTCGCLAVALVPPATCCYAGVIMPGPCGISQHSGNTLMLLPLLLIPRRGVACCLDSADAAGVANLTADFGMILLTC